MEQTNITQKIKEYIYENKISVSQIQKDTGIPSEKLQMNNEKKLKAGEFLELCNYLKLEPENL